MKNLELSFCGIGMVFIIPAIIMIFFKYNIEGNGDSANWLQAFVAIFTLLAVIYTAIKAKKSI